MEIVGPMISIYWCILYTSSSPRSFSSLFRYPVFQRGENIEGTRTNPGESEFLPFLKSKKPGSPALSGFYRIPHVPLLLSACIKKPECFLENLIF